jgi:hypothetical protein
MLSKCITPHVIYAWSVSWVYIKLSESEVPDSFSKQLDLPVQNEAFLEKNIGIQTALNVKIAWPPLLFGQFNADGFGV